MPFLAQVNAVPVLAFSVKLVAAALNVSCADVEGLFAIDGLGGNGVTFAPLIAEALALSGLMYSKADDIQGAKKAMVEAFWIADSSRHDEIRAEVASYLVFVVGYQEGHFKEAQGWAQAGESVLQRLGGRDLLRAWLLNDIGCMFARHGDKEAAVQNMKAGLALKEKVLGPDHPDVGLSETNIAIPLQGMGRSEEALAHSDRSIAILEKGLGAGHPDLGNTMSNHGEILNALGRYEEARASFERAETIWERELGSNNLNLGYPLTGIGLSFLGEGKPSSALLPLERALTLRMDSETEPALRAETAFALARALWESGRGRARSRELAEEAKVTYAKISERDALASIEDWLRDHP